MDHYDIVERLREHADRVAGGFTWEKTYDPETLCLEHEAADTIEALRARVAELEAVLPDPDKLILLARLFDEVDKGTNRSDEIQRDLRVWAKKIRDLLA